MADESKSPINPFAVAKRSNEYAHIAWTPEDVRRIRPVWDGPEAQHFLEQHEVELAHMMLEVGWKALVVLIELHEREAGKA